MHVRCSKSPRLRGLVTEAPRNGYASPSPHQFDPESQINEQAKSYVETKVLQGKAPDENSSRFLRFAPCSQAPGHLHYIHSLCAEGEDGAQEG